MISESVATLSLFDELPPVQEAGYRATVVRSHTRRLPGDPQTPTETKKAPKTAPAIAKTAPTRKRRTETINGMPRQDSYHSDYVDTPACLPQVPAPVPHNGTETSRAGAAMVEASGKAASQYERIRLLLLAHNDTGLTRQEIADKSGIRLSSVCGRVSQLISDGVCVETGLTRVSTEGVPNKVVRVGEFRPPIAHSVCFACKSFSLESRLYYIQARGYLSVRICSNCGHKEVA